MIIADARGKNLFKEFADNRIPKTDADGRFEIPGRVPGMLTVFSLDWQLQTVRIERPLKEPIKIAMRKGKRVEFRAVDPQGRPIAGIRIYPERPHRQFVYDVRDRANNSVLDFLGHRNLIQNRSDANGLFVWENAPDEALAYQIIGSEVLSQPGGEYGPEGSPHTLVFRPTVPVAATVVDSGTGEPIAKYEIIQGAHFKSNRPGMWSWYSHTPVKGGEIQAGRFSDRLLTLDRVIRYRVQAEGYRPEVSVTLDAASLPNEPVVLEFRLQKQAEYVGTLFTPDGMPAGGAEIYMKVADRARNGRLVEELSSIRIVDGNVDPQSVTSSMRAAADGEFHLDPGNDPFNCFISHESGYAMLRDTDLFAQRQHTLTPWAAIRGKLFLKGEPAPNVSVSGRQMDLVQASWTKVTDAIGNYEFNRCIAGRIDERITYFKSPRYVQNVVLDLAADRTVVQRLGVEGADLVGDLRLPSGWEVDRDKSYARLAQEEEQPPAPDGKPRISGTQQILQSVHDRVPEADNSFRFFNLLPVKHKLNFSLSLQGPNGSEGTWSKSIQITPEMFVGKNSRSPVDLGEIAVTPEK
jgi:hypothetical protein